VFPSVIYALITEWKWIKESRGQSTGVKEFDLDTLAAETCITSKAAIMVTVNWGLESPNKLNKTYSKKDNFDYISFYVIIRASFWFFLVQK